MTVRAFFKLVEIQTKAASVFPFLIGTLYAAYRFGGIDPLNMVLMFSSMLCFDMAATALNNYMDYKTARIREGYGYERHNAIPRYGLSPFAAKTAVAVLLSAASLLGFLLFLRTDVIVLVLGMLCFLLGIVYSWGPLPLSRTPFSEAVSGFAMGYLIPFLAGYIHFHDTDLFFLRLERGVVSAGADIRELLYLLLLTMPAVTGIANIMLANNICDRAEDEKNGRRTLVSYIGLRGALFVFAFLYILGFSGLAAAIILGAAPVVSTAVLLAAPILFFRTRTFFRLQRKDQTFVLSVQNFILVSALLAGTLAAGILIK